MAEDDALKDVTGCGVGFLSKIMLERDAGKRRVKPVQKHLIQLDFGLEDSDEDSDFNVSDDDDDDDDDGDDGGDDDDDDDDENSETGNSDESGEKNEEEKPYYFGMDVDDCDENEDYVLTKLREKQQKQKPKNIEKLIIKSPELSQTLPEDRSEVMSKPRLMKVLICCLCLGDISETDDEIEECDNSSVAVHEGFYGISDNQSSSTETSARTEPWFCDACKTGVKPTCQLCPNEGGIFKETDAGKWVVCALYIPGVAFGDEFDGAGQIDFPLTSVESFDKMSRNSRFMKDQ